MAIKITTPPDPNDVVLEVGDGCPPPEALVVAGMISAYKDVCKFVDPMWTEVSSRVKKFTQIRIDSLEGR